MQRLFVRMILALALMLPVQASAQFEVSGRGATLRIGGRLQTQYRTSSVEGFSDQIFTRRARIIVDVTLNDFLSARVQPDFAGVTSVKDAWVRLNFAPEFQVYLGQFKQAFDLFELSSSTDLSIIERNGGILGVRDCFLGACTYSRLTEGLLYADRDQGIRVDGTMGRISYSTSFTDGILLTSGENSSAVRAVAGRLTFAVTDDLRLSGQFALQDYPDPDTTAVNNATGAAFGGDVEYGTWRDGLLVQAAYVTGDNWRLHEEVGRPGPTFSTAQLVASYYFPVDGPPHLAGLEPLARISWADPDVDTDDNGGVMITPGFMAYIMGRTKVGFNVDIYDPKAPDADTEYSFKLQTFIYF